MKLTFSSVHCRLAGRIFKTSHLIVVRAVGGLLHGRVLLVISNLHTHHGVHVKAYQLSGLNHCDADLMGDISTLDMTLKA